MEPNTPKGESKNRPSSNSNRNMSASSSSVNTETNLVTPQINEDKTPDKPKKDTP